MRCLEMKSLKGFGSGTGERGKGVGRMVGGLERIRRGWTLSYKACCRSTLSTRSPQDSYSFLREQCIECPAVLGSATRMRRSRLKILPARCLTFLGFILVMLVCPTIAEINIGVGDVYEPGYSDSELQHPAAKFLRNGYEVCQMKDSPRRLDFLPEQPRDSRIASLEEGLRFSRKSEPKRLHETISRRGERIQNCYDSRRNGDSVMRRSAVNLRYNSGIANREVSEVRGQKLGTAVSSRTERSNSIEFPQRVVEVANKARQRMTSERRNDRMQRYSRNSPELKGERLNREDMSYRKHDERNILRRMTSNDYSRSVDTRRTSNERRESSEMLNSARTGATNSNMNERWGENFRKSTIDRENSVQRLTRRSSSINQNKARISSEVRKPEKERSMMGEERRLKTRGMSSEGLSRSDTQRRITDSERRDSARRTVRMTRTSGLDLTERRLTLSSEQRRDSRDVRLNSLTLNDNRRQERESTRRDHRAIRMARSLERRSSVDSERQERVSERVSDGQRRDRVFERKDATRQSIRIVRSVDSIPAEIRATVEYERHQRIRETTRRVTRLSENRRQDRESERREPTRLSLRRYRSLESIPVERRSITEDRRQFRNSGQPSNVVIQSDSRRQERTSERRDTALPSGRMVRSVRATPSGSISTSIVESGNRQRTTDISLNFRRGSERRDATRLAARIVRSLETEPEERRTFLGSDRQLRRRDASLNIVRRTDTSEKQRQSERRDVSQRIVRMEPSPSLSETQRRTLNTALNTRRQERELEVRDTARRSSRMVRSVEPLERRSILDSQRNQENRDATYNTILQARNRIQQKESERRDILNNGLKMARSSVRRMVVDSENQRRVRDTASSSRAQQRESQRRDTSRQSIRMTRSLETIRTERRLTEDSERRHRTRNAPMNIRRPEMEVEGREPDRRSARVVRSTESVPQERRSSIGIEKLDMSREVSLNPIRLNDNRRQQKESERRDLARRDIRTFRSLESTPVNRRLAVDSDRQERSRDITLSSRRQKRDIGIGDAVRRSIRKSRSLGSLATETRSNLESERQIENPAKSSERRVALDLERKERLPYFASQSRRQERESERRFSTRRDDTMIRTSESNRIERRSMSNFERQERNQDAFRNSRRQEMELERRKPDLRSVRRVRSTERSPSKRSLVDLRMQERTQAISLSSQRRQMDSERRDLRGDRVVREARLSQSTPSERVSPAAYERQERAREFSVHTSRQANNARQYRESETGDFRSQVNRMTRSVESFNSRSKAASEKHLLTRDSTSNFRRQESQIDRRNLALHSRASEYRNDEQRREMSRNLSLQKQIRTTRATSQENRSEDRSRISSFISDAEKSNKLVVSRASLNRETSSRKISVSRSNEARNINRSADKNLRTIENLWLSQIREGRLDSRSRNERTLYTDATPITVASGMRNRVYSPTRRINQNIPVKISAKMERIIGDVEGRFGRMLADNLKRDDKVLGSFYMSETQLSPDAHVNARNVLIIANDRLLESSRRNAIRNSHTSRDMMSRTANLQRKVPALLESNDSGRISRDAARASVVRPSKQRSFVLAEQRKHLTERKTSMNSPTRRITALGREMSLLQTDARASKAMKRSQLLNERVSDKIIPKSFQDLNGVEKTIYGHIPITDSYDVVESYSVIHSNNQGKKLLMKPSHNESSPFTQAHAREMDYSGKIVENPKQFEDEESDQKIGFGLNQDKLFSLTIGGSVAAFLISTSLK